MGGDESGDVVRGLHGHRHSRERALRGALVEGGGLGQGRVPADHVERA
jgi:hypothetical protein